MKDKIYINIGQNLGLMVANSTPTFAPNEEEYLRKTPILDWVRGLFQNLDDADRKEALGFFPELAELDDERVGRLLYCIVRENTAIKAVLEANGVSVDRALEYLESHKGKNYVHENPMTAKFHKPEDGVKYDMYFEDAQAYIEKRGFSVPWNDGDVFVDKDYLVQTVANIIRWADENGSEWSEEDEKKLNDVIRIIENNCGLVESIRNHYINFLKSIRPSQTQITMNTIIEKIRAEVERRKKELEKDKTIHPANQAGRIKELGLILSRLSVIEKEEKPSDGLEEAVEGVVTTRSMAGNIVTAHLDHTYKDGQKVKLIIIKED